MTSTPDLAFFLSVGTLPVLNGVEVPAEVDVFAQAPGRDPVRLGDGTAWSDHVGVCVGVGVKAFVALKRFQTAYPNCTRLDAIVGTTSDGRRVLLRVVATDRPEAPGKWVHFLDLDEPE